MKAFKINFKKKGENSLENYNAVKFVEENLKTIFAYSFSRVGNRTEAEDLTSEIILAIIQNGDKIAVGADIKDGKVAIKGWVEKSQLTADAFFAKMQDIGVSTVICTDVSRDGAMKGTNVALYEYLCKTYSGCNIVASGGVSSYADIESLLKIEGLWGAIVGKACYTGDIDVRRAVEMTEAVK